MNILSTSSPYSCTKIPHFLQLTVAQTSMLEMRPHSHKWSQKCRACEHVACSHLFSCLSFSVARNCSTNIFTVFLAGASLHLYWFLNQHWTVTIEFVCRNHSAIRVFFSVVSGRTILNDVTVASVAKYGKNTNVWRLRRYHLHPAVFFIVYRSTKIYSNWNTLYFFITCFRGHLWGSCFWRQISVYVAQYVHNLVVRVSCCLWTWVLLIHVDTHMINRGIFYLISRLYVMCTFTTYLQ